MDDLLSKQTNEEHTIVARADQQNKENVRNTK